MNKNYNDEKPSVADILPTNIADFLDDNINSNDWVDYNAEDTSSSSSLSEDNTPNTVGCGSSHDVRMRWSDEVEAQSSGFTETGNIMRWSDEVEAQSSGFTETGNSMRWSDEVEAQSSGFTETGNIMRWSDEVEAQSSGFTETGNIMRWSDEVEAQSSGFTETGNIMRWSDEVEAQSSGFTETGNINDKKQGDTDLSIEILPIDKLLQELNYKILYLHLKELLTFIDGNSKECSLPFINIHHKELFKRIVWDFNVLHLKCFDAKYRDICDKIIHSVDNHKDKIAYAFEPTPKHSQVLVFKKVFKNPPQQTPVSTVSGPLETLELSQSSSIAATHDILKISSNTFDNITHNFKVCCFKIIRTFLENTFKRKIIFTELNMEQVQYMHHLFSKLASKEKSDNLFKIESRYSSLWVINEILSVNYVFKFHVQSVAEKKSLVVEKIHRNLPADDRTTMVPEIVDMKLQLQRPLMQLSPKKIKNIGDFVELIETFPPAFVIEALGNIIEFLASEEGKAEIIFVPEDADEALFYKHVRDYAQSCVNKPIDEEYIRLFDRITKLLVNIKWKVPTASKNKRNEVTGMKEVKYRKLPRSSSSSQDNVQRDNQRTTMIEKESNGIEGEKSSKCTYYIPQEPSPAGRRNKKKKAIKKENSGLEVGNSWKCTCSNPHEPYLAGSYSKLTKKQKKKLLKLRKEQKCPNVEESLRCRPEVTEVASENRSPAISVSVNSNTNEFKKPNSLTSDKPSGILLSKKVNFEPATRESDISESENDPFSNRGSLDRGKKGIDFIKSSPNVNSNTNEFKKPNSLTSDKPSGILLREIKEQLVQKHQNESNRSDIRECGMRNSRFRTTLDGKSKENLKRGLSVPVQSHKAMKMMQGMGWSGGGLGAKGTGITEPIMPDIDIKKGAGFGHVENTNKLKKPVKIAPKNVKSWVTEDISSPQKNTDVVVQKTKKLLNMNPPPSFDLLTKALLLCDKGSPFRCLILENILDLLASEDTKKVLKYSSQIPKKDVGFLKHVVKSFSKRSKLVYAGPEQDLIDRIQEKFAETPSVVIDGNVSNKKKEITITKIQAFTDDQMKQHIIMLKGTKADVWTAEAVDKNVTVFLKALEPSCSTDRILKNLKLKVHILLKILIFISSNVEKLEVPFDQVINKYAQRKYVKAAIVGANTKLPFGKSHAEHALSLEIINIIGDLCLGVIIDEDFTSYTLTKES